MLEECGLYTEPEPRGFPTPLRTTLRRYPSSTSLTGRPSNATMSGIEVAGLVLGAIPLIIEGFNRSQKAFAAFNTYRHYPKELTKLDAKIGAQKTVFRNNCINLLSTITNDRQKVHAMLSETSHSGWQDENMHSTLASRIDALDESFTSCQRTMDQIYQALRDICRESEAFQTVLMASNEVSPFAS